MEKNYTNAIANSFIVSKTNGKVQTLFKEEDYGSLQQCDTLYDILTKLSLSSYTLSSEINTKSSFKKGLNENLIKEFNEIYKNSEGTLKKILDYYKNQHKIHNFTYLLASKEHDFDLSSSYEKIEEMGKFLELETLKFACDMNEVYKFCVEQTFLKKYYRHINIRKEIKENNFQLINTKFSKMLLEDFYEDIEEDCYMKEILKCEGDRRIIELVLNTLDSSIKGHKRAEMFPKICTIDLGMRSKLADCGSFDELRGILSSHYRLRKIVGCEDDEIIGALLNLEVDIYLSAFNVYNDVSCVYAYFKMKEQEIKNILWTVDCISMKKKDFIKNVILPQNIEKN